MNYFDILLAKKLEDDRDPKVEGLSVTENGRYHEDGVVYDPVIVALPLDKKTITANGTYKASDDDLEGYNEVEVEVPMPANAYLLKDIPNTPTAIATFSDGANLPMPKLEVAIEPVQDLHGYDSPWVGGAGKNKLQNVRSTTTINGITFTVNNDGSVFIAGGQTASEFTVFNLIANNLNYYNLTDFGLSYNTDYIINGCPSGGSSTTYRLVFRSGGSAGNKVDTGSGASFNIASDGNTLKWMPCIMIDANYTTPSSGLLFKPMIRLSSVSDATFAPYSNICPISGWSAVDVTVQDDIDNPTVTHTTTIPFLDSQGNPIEVYGGSVDVVNGGGSAYKEYDSYNGETLIGPWISDRDVYVPNTSPTIGAQVVDMGDTSTFTSQPTSIKSLQGLNNVFADTGDIIEGQYFSKEE